ncbi:GNAT family N-acetyltransferase [Brevundimonas sp. LM2]|uniref:GNAT family N-acetyltransferase n=1 Tax=Brevundimonas sp. LM2 TaxID=1938605 RepID=UPI000983A767|nr:GNAT family N-acetyltransferase [Brevundimonas sp. LM2]AQR61973.1 GNAT family N-acetyltransferase [Brevundimonas sp. LM2]
MSQIVVRPATDADWPAIWPIVEAVVRAGETYTWPRDLAETDARGLWIIPPPGLTLVAVDGEQVLGTAKITPNQMGPGAHVANASCMVDADARGRGLGRLLGQTVLDRARDAGFRAMQFNAVVETNVAAVTLWASLGFDILATVPEAFDHPTRGLVGLHIMYRRL